MRKSFAISAKIFLNFEQRLKLGRRATDGECVTALPANRDGTDAVVHRLRGLMEDFERGDPDKREQIRDLLTAGVEGFYPAAIAILKNPPGLRSLQFLVVLLVSNDLLMRALCDPALQDERALELARLALRVDAMADVTLARALADTVEASKGPEELSRAGRLLKILDEVSDGTRIFSSLMRILRHSDASLRSKAVLMIGRGNKSVKWVHQRLLDSDSRIRANAVESLWGVDTDPSRELLRSMLGDADNRVAGNALLALYMLGEKSAIGEIWRMFANPSPAFRATCAWVMGETGDPRFSEAVAGMLKDPSATVRKRAFSAMRRLKSAAAVLAQAPSFCLTGRTIASAVGTERRIALAIGARRMAAVPRILPTHIVLTGDGRPITAYEVIETAPPEDMAVAFLLPRGTYTSGLSWSDTALECLTWKRPGDAWGRLTYIAGTAPEDESHTEGVHFLVANDAISADFRRRQAAAECTDVWRSLGKAMGSGQRTGRRHVIVFCGTPVSGKAGPELLTAAISGEVLVQVISICPNPSLEDFCDRVHGVYFQCGKADDLPAHAVHAYLNLLARYEIRFQPVEPEAREIKVRLCHPQASGETMVPVARRPPAGQDSAETGDGW